MCLTSGSLSWHGMLLFNDLSVFFAEQVPFCFSVFFLFLFQVFWVAHQEKNKNLPDNGGPQSADVNAETHVASHHSLNTIIVKSSGYLR